MEVSDQLIALATLLLGKEPPGTHWVAGWVGPRTSLGVVAKTKVLPQLGIELWLSIP